MAPGLAGQTVDGYRFKKRLTCSCRCREAVGHRWTAVIGPTIGGPTVAPSGLQRRVLVSHHIDIAVALASPSRPPGCSGGMVSFLLAGQGEAGKVRQQRRLRVGTN
jgi:hypothetical protein